MVGQEWFAVHKQYSHQPKTLVQRRIRGKDLPGGKALPPAWHKFPIFPKEILTDADLEPERVAHAL
jgi:hypothetical protein